MRRARGKGSRCAAAAGGPHRPRTPLPRAGFAVARVAKGEVKRTANLPDARVPHRANAKCTRRPGRENQLMPTGDAELERFRNEVNCAALLEGFGPRWRLDRKESTRRALKYRRGEGEVLIVNHDGRGWWDPQSSAKGDIFDLVQFLDPSLNFGQVRQVLRRFVGVAPRFPEAHRRAGGSKTVLPVALRWAKRPRLHRVRRPGSI